MIKSYTHFACEINKLNVFFFSKSAEFLHVGSDSLEKHCPAFFFNCCREITTLFPQEPFFKRKMVQNHKNNVEPVDKYWYIIKTNLFPLSYHSLVQNFNGIDFILRLVLGKKNL